MTRGHHHKHFGRAAACAALLAAAPAGATVVQGTVIMPPEARTLAPRASTYWRVENGVLPVAPIKPDPATEVVLVLQGGPPPAPRPPDDPAPAPPKVTIDLRGVRMDPPVAIAPAGVVVTFKNGDRVTHNLFVKGATSLMGPQPTPAGQERTQRFLAAAEYPIQDEEYPHVRGTIVVVDSPHVARVDERGGFQFDVPEGQYKLRAYFRGAWVVNQPVDVTARGGTVTVKIPPPAENRREGNQ